MSILRQIVVVLLQFLVLGGCAAAKPAALNVCAAASLRSAFEAIDRAFAAAHGGADVSLSSAGSQTLKSQLEAGAPCDVIATADELTMNALVASGHAVSPRRFASNTLVIIVPTANPAKLATWVDLARAPRIALAAPEVPVGRYARAFIANADAQQPGFAAAVEARVKTLELDAAHAVMRVRHGEVDAAIAYRTDARAAGLAAIAIPPELDVTADYPIAIVETASDPALAAAFVAYVLGPGAAILAEHGFSPARL